MLDALKEWRDARQAIFDYVPVPVLNKKGEREIRYPPEMWSRLASAEAALMCEAERL